MLTITLTVEDLARTRLAVSPLWETVASIRLLKTPRAQTFHQEWVRTTKDRIARAGAELLSQLDTPRSTTELARRTGLTAGGVSQHLGALRSGGLVTPHRVGRMVLYARTSVAEALLEAAEQPASG